MSRSDSVSRAADGVMADGLQCGHPVHLPAPLTTSPRISHVTRPGGVAGPARRSPACRPPQLLNRIRRCGGAFMLPYMHHGPAHSFKLGVFLPVTFHIALKFFPPPFTIVFRENAVVGTRMPETAVNEHRYPCRGECDVRAGRESLGWLILNLSPRRCSSLRIRLRASRRAWHPLHLGGNGHAEGFRSAPLAYLCHSALPT